LADYEETVVLVLRDVIFRNMEIKFLSEFLIKKYGFRIEEDKIKETTKTKDVIFEESKDFCSDLEQGKETQKYSTNKILAGTFSDVEIKIYLMGELAQREDIVEVSEKEKYKVYNSKYQLIKAASKSGYAISKFLEQLMMDLSIEIKNKEWFFHRSKNA
jgi:hypothetical protein